MFATDGCLSCWDKLVGGMTCIISQRLSTSAANPQHHAVVSVYFFILYITIIVVRLGVQRCDRSNKRLPGILILHCILCTRKYWRTQTKTNQASGPQEILQRYLPAQRLLLRARRAHAGCSPVKFFNLSRR